MSSEAAVGRALKAGTGLSHANTIAADMRGALARARRTKPVYSALGWCVFVVPDMALGVFHVDAEEQKIITGEETWDLLSFESRAKYSVLDRLRAASTGIRVYPATEGPLLDAIRAKTTHDGSTPVVRVDLLADLLARAEKLVLEAAGLNEVGESPLQRRIFDVRFAEVSLELQAVKDTVLRIERAVDMAAEAV